MRSLTFILGLTLLACAVSEEKVESVSDGVKNFATDFFKELSTENEKENFVCSPLSAYFTLSLAAAGAGGNTAKQLYQALHLPTDDAVIRQGFQNLVQELNNTSSATIEIANKMYLASDLKLKDEFSQLTRDVFSSEVDTIDVAKPDEAANAINEWVEKKTHNKIDDIIDDDDITGDSRMFLLNTIYFRSIWKEPFEEEDTLPREFHFDKDTVKEVPTMHVIGDFFHDDLPELKAKFIQMRYEDDDLSMYVIVPDEIDGLKHIQENLHLFNISSFAGSENAVSTYLYIPKFKVESSHDLKDNLEKMGMTDMFGSAADFTGIADELLQVTKISQKIFIEVTEAGTEAAAVTVGGIGNRFGSSEFRVDRPFVYVIAKKDVILFAGSLVDPTDD